MTTNQPSPAEMIVAELTHRGSSEYVGAAQPVSIRLHLSNYTMLQAMAEEAGVARSHFHNHLIAAGIEAVWSDLPEDVRQRIEKRRSDILGGLVKAGKLEAYSEEG